MPKASCFCGRTVHKDSEDKCWQHLPRRQIERRTPIKPVNRKRRAEKFERNFGEKSHWIRSLPCEISDSASPCAGDIEASHVVPRGMGGAGGSKEDLVPHCHGHHQMFHAIGLAEFDRIYKTDSKARAAELDAEWKANHE